MNCWKTGVAGLLVSAVGLAAVADDDGSKRHLVGFTFSNGWTLENISRQALAWLNQGALTGAGVDYARQYSGAATGPAADRFGPRIEWLKTNCRKDIWPVLYTNSMLGFDPGNLNTHASARNNASKLKHLTAFRGLDLDNAAGMRALFERNWSEAIKIARALGSPGIMFDNECYNDGRAAYIDGAALDPQRKETNKSIALAQLRGSTPAETKRQCMALGAQLADLAHDVYPGMTIWSFFTKLDQPEYRDNSTNATIFLGMLERCREQRYTLRIIDGGEGGLGYLHPSATVLAKRIRNRWIKAKPILETYPHYELGGVNAPFIDRETQRAYWMFKDRIGGLQNIEDHEPYFTLLFNNYRTTWLYGASNAYYPFGSSTPRVAAVLRAAMTESVYALPAPGTLPDTPEPIPELERKEIVETLDIETVHGARTTAVLLNFAKPAETGIALDAAAMPARAKAKLVLVSAQPGVRYAVELRLGDWKLGWHEWPGIETKKLPVRDFTAYQGIAMDVANVGEHEGEIGWEIGDDTGQNWYKYYRLEPGASRTISVTTAMLETRLDHADRVAYIKVMTRRPPHPTRWQLGNLVLVPATDDAGRQ